MHHLRLVLILFIAFSPVVNAQVWVEADGESSVREIANKSPILRQSAHTFSDEITDGPPTDLRR